MEGEQVQQQASTQQPVSDTQQEQPRPQKSSKILTVLLVIITILSLCLSGYLAYQNRMLSNKISEIDNISNIEEETSNTENSRDGASDVELEDISTTKIVTYLEQPSDWKVYENDKYGFSFKYDPSLTFKPIDITTPSEVDEGGINRTEYFMKINNSQPPDVLFGIHPYYEPSTGGAISGVRPNNFVVYVMENDTDINVDDWYDRYIYFPLGFSKERFDQYTKNTIVIDGIEGKYVSYKDVVQQNHILISKDDYIYLIHHGASEIDNQILSTFDFTDQ